jgi:endoglucanase
MLASADPARARLLTTFQPMADYVGAHGFPPEKVDSANGNSGPNAGPWGFSAAMIPMLDALDQPALADSQLARIAELEPHAPAAYFSQVLTLFGTGWHEARYRFAADGSLRLAWGAVCSSSPH